MHRSRRRIIVKLTYTLIFAVAFIVWIFPIALTVMTSLKTDTEVQMEPLHLPRHPTFDAYVNAWETMNIPQMMRNSAFLSIGGAALAIVVALTPAYALSRFRITGAEFFFILFLTGMMIPQQAVVIPLYEVLRWLKLIDSLWGLVVVHAAFGFPFVLLILRGAMVGIPPELEDASRVDGCSDFSYLCKIVVPLVKPALIIAGVLQVLANWNDLFFAYIFLNSTSKLPITVGLTFVSEARHVGSWNLPAATLLIAQLPTVILYVIAYRYIQQGVFAGAVK